MIELKNTLLYQGKYTKKNPLAPEKSKKKGKSGTSGEMIEKNVMEKNITSAQKKQGSRSSNIFKLLLS